MISKNDTILVTGAHGLVGSAVVELFRSSGFSRIVPAGRRDCDLTDKASTIAFFEKHKPDHVFHAAARVYGIMGNMKNQALSFYDNSTINLNVVDSAHKVGVKKITVMGTAAAYPYPSPGLPLKEDMIFQGRPHHSESAYAHAKRAMLAMLEAYAESYGLKWAYIVSCNLYGIRDKFDTEFGHVIPSLIKKFHDAKQSGGKVSVWGDGSAQRDFMYIKDAARVSRMIMESMDGMVNIGTGEVVRIRDVVDILGSITGLSDRIEWDSSKPNGQDYRAYDLSRITNAGFRCEYSLREGLQETWDWYQENPG